MRNQMVTKMLVKMALKGKKVEKPLICFGTNPSTAEPGSLDNTIKSVGCISKANGYDSWIMLNIYPQRATNTKDMCKERDLNIAQENLLNQKETVPSDFLAISIEIQTN